MYVPQHKSYPKVIESQLTSIVDRVTNILRGAVEASEYKQYVFPLLFLKWMSDEWDYQYLQAEEDGYDLTDEDELAAFYQDYKAFVIPEGSHWEQIMAVSSKRGVALKQAFSAIEEANPQLDGLFPKSTPWEDTAKLPESNIENSMNEFHKVTMNSETMASDVLGNVYEYMLKYFADESGARAGEFYTPREVVQLLVRVLHPTGNETIMDPTCGSGGMLIEAAHEVQRLGGNSKAMQFLGQELTVTTSAIARMNLMLHGLDRVEIVQGDTLAEPKLLTETGKLRKASVTLANPPFSISSWDRDRWMNDPYGRNQHGTPPQQYADWAFVQHMLATMNPKNGRVGVVLPHGTLFRNQGEGEIRKSVVESDLLDAVIGLPSNLFYGAGIPACILIFRAQKPEERQGKVLFVDAQLRFKAAKNQNRLGEDDVAAIVAAFDDGVDPDGEGGIELRLVDKEEIAKNKFDLSISKYVSAIKGEEVLPFAEAQQILSIAAEARKSSEDVFLAALKSAGYEL